MNSRRGPREPIDWAAVRDRLARSHAAIAESLEPSPERARAILDERARVLARAIAAPAAEPSLDVLIFSLGRDRYAIESRYVREVIRTGELTPVPGAPSFVVGVANLRGEILLIVDLRKVFSVGTTSLSDLARIVVVGDQRAEFGVLADETHDIVAVLRSALHEPPESLAGISCDHVLGVTASALTVLDGSALIGDDRLYVRSRTHDTGSAPDAT